MQYDGFTFSLLVLFVSFVNVHPFFSRNSLLDLRTIFCVLNAPFSQNTDRSFADSKSVFKFLSFLFVILPGLTLLHAEQIDSITVSKNQNAFIYVGSEITIQGNAYIYTGETAGNNKKTSGNSLKGQAKAASPSKNISFSKKNILINTLQEKKLKKLQQEISKRFQNCYYSGSQDILHSQRRIQILAASAVSNILRYSDSAKTDYFSDYILNSFEIILEKQKFYTSISHLLSSKMMDSSLRGPPSIS